MTGRKKIPEFRFVPYVDRTCFSIGQENDIFPDADVLCCLEIKPVDLHVAAERSSRDIGRQCNSLSSSRQERIVSAVPNQGGGHHALRGRSPLRLYFRSDAGRDIVDVVILQAVS